MTDPASKFDAIQEDPKEASDPTNGLVFKDSSDEQLFYDSKGDEVAAGEWEHDVVAGMFLN